MRRMIALGMMAAVITVLGILAPVSATTGDDELTPEQIQALNEAREQGRTFFQQRKYREAAEAYRRAAQMDSTDAPTYFNLGLCYQSLNNNRDAIVALRRAVTLDPMFGPAHLEIAKVFLKQENLEEAEREYHATKRILADSVQYLAAAEQGLATVAVAYTNRAIVSLRQRKYPEARADAARAMELAPEISRPFYIGGHIEESARDYDAAERYYRAAVARAEDDARRAEALEGVGRILNQRARDADRDNNAAAATRLREQAAEFLTQSAQADSSRATTFVNLGNTLFELARYEEAARALSHAEKLDPRDYKSPFKLAEAYMRLERCSEAEQAASRAIRLQPMNASAHAVRAEALECLGRLQDAINEYDEAKRDPRWRQRCEYKIKKLQEELSSSAQGR